MPKLNQKQWIAVTIALIVVGVFFTTGSDFVSFVSGQFGSNQVANTANTANTAASLDQETIKQEQMNPSDSTFSSSVGGGLEVRDIVVGTGDEAVSGKTVTVHYSGAFLDGKVFDSSYPRGAPFKFNLGSGRVIPGWDMGVAGMKVGGKRHLVIPSDLAYGPTGAAGVIPPNATLVFEVELLKVE